jgi:hypothetical protein
MVEARERKLADTHAEALAETIARLAGAESVAPGEVRA